MLKKFVERLAEFDVEDGIDDRVEEAVDVAEPHEQRERHRMNVTDGRFGEQIVSDADRVDDVECEERNPA